jgi:hypothetical protein
MHDLALVYVTYGEDDVTSSLGSIIDILPKNHDRLFVVVIDNSSRTPQIHSPFSSHYTSVSIFCLCGFNGLNREFNAYETGFHFLVNNLLLAPDTNVFIANSTFPGGSTYKSFERFFRRGIVDTSKYIIARTDSYPTQPVFFEKKLCKWLRSNAIFSNLANISASTPFAPPLEAATNILETDISTPNLLREDSPYHTLEYKKYIEAWLLDSHIIEDFEQRLPKGLYSHHYNSKPSLLQKAWAICCEHYWSLKLLDTPETSVICVDSDSYTLFSP